MARTYALYFDTPRVDGERRCKRGVAALVIAVHLLALLWALRTHPYFAPPATSLVVIQLNGLANAVFSDRISKDLAPKLVSPRPASSRPKPAPRPRDETPAGGIDRATVAGGHERAGSSDHTLPDAGSLSADRQSRAAAVPSRVAGGAGALFGGFHPPQVLQRARMSYPKAAFLANAQGDVDVLITVGADGLLRDARIQASSGNGELDAASLQLIRQYRFKAAEKDGAAIEAQAVVTFDWRIGARERFEFAHLPPARHTINLDAQLKAVEFLDSVPTHRQACDHMKNPDCLASPTDD